MRFKEMEKLIYEFACELSRDITIKILENMDNELMDQRDKQRYRLKQTVKTTIKSMYGDVEFGRRYYKDNETGKHIFLLDEQIGLNKSNGLYSDNMKELIANACMDMSYGKAADLLCDSLGLSISKTACWETIQELGSKLDKREEELVKLNKDVNSNGKIVNVLFEETDGVWLKTQKRNKKKGKSLETKIVTLYEGWDRTNPSRLVGRTIIGGVSGANKLKKKTEAVINSIYNIDEIKLRVINGDGAGWIGDMSDGEIVYQLDRFHVMEYINRYIKDIKCRSKVKKLLNEKKIDDMINYIEMVYNSIAGQDKKETEGMEILLRYLKNNKSCILRYNERDDIKIPDPDDGIIYKNMGVQESQNCSLITMRMKHRRMRWSEAGANNLIRLLCYRANNNMDAITKLLDLEIPVAEEEIKKEFSCADIPKVIGKDKYFDLYNVMIPILSSASSPLTESIKGLQG